MCGICGVVSAEPIFDSGPVLQMQNTLRHRGPDGSGRYSAPHISLAVRRLSIIDLIGGDQPLYDETDDLVLIANAEIYNFVELRRELEHRGHRFRSGSDCETILHLYQEQGCECIHALRGMFAFAIWDTQKRRLLLARDRMGEKPLYLYQSDGMLVFASELKALLRSGLVPFELDAAAVDLYFHYQYVPEPLTPIRGVRKLPAGHFLTVDATSWQIEQRRYWNIEDAPPIDGEPGELIRQELEEICKIIIRSDVPVGVALSGGIDSGGIAALAARHYPGTLQAFSVGYPGYPRFDERNEARSLAEHLKIPFHDIELRTEDMVTFFPELVCRRDDPIADISGYGYYSVMKLARDHGVPVMIQGQGGDELFWGYSWLRQALKESLQKQNLRSNGWPATLDYLTPRLPKEWTAWAGKEWLRSLGGIRNGWNRYHYHKTTCPNQMVFYDLVRDFQAAHSERMTLFTPSFLESAGKEGGAFELFTFDQPWESTEVRMTRLICETYLLENGIAQGDRLSMASSVELRLPLVDHRVVETVIGLRKQNPDSRLPPKAWLKSALKGILPEWVMRRPKKGFQPPVKFWHRALFEAYGSWLGENGYLVREKILTPEAARSLAGGPFPAGAVTPVSFKALVLEVWCRKFSE
jgi:asparagine synthase (glutamine-hydrolysing)